MLACESKSMSKTLRPNSASAAPREIVVVVLPTPPFWLTTETTRAGPGAGKPLTCGKSIIFRPRTLEVADNSSSRFVDLVPKRETFELLFAIARLYGGAIGRASVSALPLRHE